jgi:hypothetical protein
MDPKYYGAVEMLLSFGVVLGILIWQLVSVRRSIRKDEENEKKK